MPFIHLLTLMTFTVSANAQREIHSTSFETCMENSRVTASNLKVSFFSNRTLTFTFNGTSTFSGNGTLGYDLLDSGAPRYQRSFTPCSFAEFTDFCPINVGAVNVITTRQIPDEALNIDQLFTASDLDAEFRFHVNDSATDQPVGCLKARLSNDNMTAGAGADEGGSSSGTSHPSWTILMLAMVVVALFL